MGGHQSNMTCFILMILELLSVQGCTYTHLQSTDGYNGVLAGRTMDWAHSFDDLHIITPRGVHMDGGLGEQSEIWTARYGSLVSSISGWSSKQISNWTNTFLDRLEDGGTDGVNEKGLGVHLLYLGSTTYHILKPGEKGVTYARWVRYILDNCANVQEAVDLMAKTNIVSMEMKDPRTGNVAALGAHVAVEDITGDSAVFEVIDGKVKIYHKSAIDYDTSVMTNDPPFDQQIELLADYQSFGGETPIPGDIDSPSRFVISRYFKRHLEENGRQDQGGFRVSDLNALLNKAMVPHGAPYDGGVYPTWWRSAIDYNNGLYYWQWENNPYPTWTNFNKIKEEGWYTDGEPYRYLDGLYRNVDQLPADTRTFGDVTLQFKPSFKPSSQH